MISLQAHGHIMASISSPQPSDKQKAAALQLSSRLKSCWELDIDWTLFPTALTEVNTTMHNHVYLLYKHVNLEDR